MQSVCHSDMFDGNDGDLDPKDTISKFGKLNAYFEKVWGPSRWHSESSSRINSAFYSNKKNNSARLERVETD
jgi:hypothetical protein